MLYNYFKPELLRVIDEYVGWKYERHPLIAGAQKAILYRFARSFGLQEVSSIEFRHIAFYVGEQLTGFYSEQALRAIRGFLWYAERAGYKTNFSYKMATQEGLKKVGRKVDWECVKRVKVLREGENLPIRTISEIMSVEQGRKIYPNSVFRWIKKIPQLP